MFTSIKATKATQSRRTAQGRRDLGHEITDRLAKAFEHLSLLFSAIGARWPAERELKNRETRQCEIGYEARKRQLLIALRQKISERQARID
jgi:hypothetical protein